MLPTDSYRFETQFKVARMILFRIKSFPLDCHGYKIMEMVVLELRGFFFTITSLTDSPQFASLGRSEHAWKKYRKLTKL